MTTTTISPARHRSLGDHTWQDQAVCQSTEHNPVDPHMFFPEPDETAKIAAAKSLCGQCPVRRTCLDAALEDAVAQTSPAATRAELGAAARSFERATRSHVRAERADTRAIRSAARGIIQAGGALGRGEDGGTTAMLVSTLVLAALAAARWHSARGHAQQAEASRQAAEHLRAAYHQPAAAPMQALRDHGRALPEAQRRAYETTIRAALPGNRTRPGTSTKNDALAATLAEAEQAGHDPKALLHEAIAMRELDTAEDVNGVLVWRLRRLAQLPAHLGEATRRPQVGTGRATPPANPASVRAAPPASPRPAAPDPRGRPPRR